MEGRQSEDEEERERSGVRRCPAVNKECDAEEEETVRSESCVGNRRGSWEGRVWDRGRLRVAITGVRIEKLWK